MGTHLNRMSVTVIDTYETVHFCYFQNTFPFVSTFRQTDLIPKKRRHFFVEQSIIV